MASRMKEDMKSVLENDPAARGYVDAFLNYPGLHAIWWHRFANFFYRHGMVVFSKWLSQVARFLTNVEIHPGATIGRRLFIDHGAGIVIGETAEIGDDVVLFHGVTLGGTGKHKGKRHPTVKNGALISAGAKILGPITICENAKVGAGAVVIKDVPLGATVVGVPAKVVRLNGRVTQHTEPQVAELKRRLTEIEVELEKLKNNTQKGEDEQ
ncbi:serine O-acetyltransferase [Listeria newyorkensis]|uniref:Serine acetyltransferase n=1 Tax=Listeria newyorkensis TaxID=1497681 RepID=A0A841YUM5_9LIST|nr:MULTISPECIES: serine O-acetyltransferase [Listeria]KMT60867.1 serine O-acetyltransferase [Listeria newyorkensis]MBC1457100.1 serine O-acetyltransferase [Listeria newyorkensis]PNP89249.1 serine O-acetyltransferase [Listeria newyorkensis]RQW65584.1 serine O-acetyltransferase [Listeria sp. SHR_NRA_18]WAO22340.1 serine O-acetyltransferase [Listeria newyorkensis]